MLCTLLELDFNFYTLVKNTMKKWCNNAPALNILLKWAQEKSYSCSLSGPSDTRRKKKKTQFNLWSKQTKPIEKIKYVVLFLCSSQGNHDRWDPGRQKRFFSVLQNYLFFLLVEIKQTIQWWVLVRSALRHGNCFSPVTVQRTRVCQ